MKDYILFDLDGTLTDPKVGITTCVQYALSAVGVEEPDADKLTCFIGPPLKESFMEFYGFDEEKAESAIEKYRERFKDTGIFENTIYKGIPEMLKKLKGAHKKLAVASSKPTVFVERILEHFAIRKYFDVVVGSELDGRRTDKAEVIREALRQLGGKKENTVMVGDRKFDVEGAKTEGVVSVAVSYGYGSMEELKASKADYIVRSVGELEKLLMRGSESRQKDPVFVRIWLILLPLLLFYLLRMMGLSVGTLVLSALSEVLPREVAGKLVYWNETGEYLEGTTGNGSAVMTAIAFLIAGIVIWVLYAKEEVGRAEKEAVLKHSRLKTPFAYACMTVAVLALTLGLNFFYELAGLTDMSAAYQETARMQYAAVLPLGLFVNGLLIPVAEETVFRGVIYNRLKKYMAYMPAVVVSALLFGIYHQNPIQGSYALLMGCVIAYFYESFGHFYVPVAAHILSNVAGYLLTVTGAFAVMPINWWTCIGLLLIGTGALAWCIGMKHPRKNKSENRGCGTKRNA